MKQCVEVQQAKTSEYTHRNCNIYPFQQTVSTYNRTLRGWWSSSPPRQTGGEIYARPHAEWCTEAATTTTAAMRCAPRTSHNTHTTHNPRLHMHAPTPNNNNNNNSVYGDSYLAPPPPYLAPPLPLLRRSTASYPSTAPVVSWKFLNH